MSLPGVSLAEDSDRAIVLNCRPEAGPMPLTEAQLIAELESAGFAELWRDATAIQQALHRIGQGASYTGVIARRVDAQYKVAIAPNKLAAAIAVVAAQGGVPASVEGARAVLAKAGVVHGLLEDRLAAAVSACSGEPVEVARGTPPQHGSDGWLEPLVSLNVNRHPKIDDKGHVDFRDMGAIPTVQVGEALMRRHPPTAGTRGVSVQGGELPAVDGKDIKFAVRLQGVVVEAKDADLLRAEVVGQPVLLRDGVTVEPILRLETVDVESGNVRFGGSVIIRGDVHSGMKIEVDGDVTVEGVVESAEIRAGGNVLARGGIIGNAPQMAQGAQTAVHTAKIVAKGNVTTRYAENALIVAEQCVIVDESLVQSDVTAVDRVRVGKAGKKKGHILGGFVRATLGVEAEFLGGPGSGQTRVFVGANPLLQKAIEEQRQHLAAKLAEHGELSKVLKILKTRPDRKEMFDKARATLQKVSEEIAETMAEEKRLAEQLGHADEAEIRISESIAAGSMVAIGKKSRYITDDGRGATFRLSDGEIVSG
jgi:hypothetical protein